MTKQLPIKEIGSLLIEINSKETQSIIPGKLFEYMVSGRPIIAIGPNDSDFADII
jgi:hypothetical protein